MLNLENWMCVGGGFLQIRSHLQKDSYIHKQLGKWLFTITGLDWTGLDYWTPSKIECLALYQYPGTYSSFL